MMQIVLGSLFLLLLSTSHGWQIRDRIGDNELEERIIYPGKRERLIEEMNRLFTHSSLRDFHFVVSGTLWCGHGNKSSGPNELGRFKHTDACCRTHDMCPDVMSAGESKHGLTNTASHTRFPSPASLSLSQLSLLSHFARLSFQEPLSSSLGSELSTFQLFTRKRNPFSPFFLSTLVDPRERVPFHSD